MCHGDVACCQITLTRLLANTEVLAHSLNWVKTYITFSSPSRLSKTQPHSLTDNFVMKVLTFDFKIFKVYLTRIAKCKIYQHTLANIHNL